MVFEMYSEKKTTHTPIITIQTKQSSIPQQFTFKCVILMLNYLFPVEFLLRVSVRGRGGERQAVA